jgi:hypothetical protein
VGVAEIDDAKAATIARTILEEKRIASEVVVVGSARDTSEENCKETASFYALNIVI